MVNITPQLLIFLFWVVDTGNLVFECKLIYLKPQFKEKIVLRIDEVYLILSWRNDILKTLVCRCTMHQVKFSSFILTSI